MIAVAEVPDHWVVKGMFSSCAIFQQHPDPVALKRIDLNKIVTQWPIN